MKRRKLVQSVLTTPTDDKSSFLVYQSPAPDSTAKPKIAGLTEDAEDSDKAHGIAQMSAGKGSARKASCRKKLATEVRHDSQTQ